VLVVKDTNTARLCPQACGVRRCASDRGAEAGTGAGRGRTGSCRGRQAARQAGREGGRERGTGTARAAQRDLHGDGDGGAIVGSATRFAESGSREQAGINRPYKLLRAGLRKESGNNGE